MAKRKFNLSWTVECEIELDDEVIDQVDDEWRKHLYPLETPEQIAEHIAYNLVMNQWGLSMLDGWANLEDSQARVTHLDTFWWNSEETKEVKDE